MKNIQISAIAIALSALFANQAMAANNAPITRAEVKASLVEAINTGNMLVTESGLLARQISPNNYATETRPSLTRQEVRDKLATAIANGLHDQHISY